MRQKKILKSNVDKMSDFNKERLRFARNLRGLTIKKASALIGLSVKTYSDYENGHYVPTENSLDDISKTLRIPKKFFFLDDIASIKPEIVSFRSLSRLPATQRKKAIHQGEIALELSKWLEKKLKLPTPCLPDLVNHTPEAAAQTLRDNWAIGELPIKNIIHLLEGKGVRVFSLNEDTLDMDAFSFWMDNTPYIFLNNKKSAERSRFDTAHELGHLILHKHGSPTGKEAETEANRFASAFLMPEGSIKASNGQGKFITIRWVISAKAIWRVSAAALVRRLYDLEILSDWKYRSLTVELSKRGYMKNEPEAIRQKESSRLLPMVFDLLQQDGIRLADIASDLCVHSETINTLVFSNLRIIK